MKPTPLSFPAAVGLAVIALAGSLGCSRAPRTGPPAGTVQRYGSTKTAVPRSFLGYEGRLPRHARDFPDVLPAFKLPGEHKVPGKADQNDDYRIVNPEWYAATRATTEFEPDATGMVEWEPMELMLLTVSGSGLPNPIDQDIAEMAFGAARNAGIEVYLIYDDEGHRATVDTRIDQLGVTEEERSLLHWVDMESNSIWMIDYGPFSMKRADGAVALVDFRYYQPRIYDDAIPTRMAGKRFGLDVFRMPVDFEGGNLQVDSQGTCYSSQGLLLYNSATQAELEELFKAYVGCDRLVIMQPLKDEGTTHIDMFFKLVDDHTAIVGSYTPQQDAENRALMDQNQKILESVALPDGEPITVHRMPMPNNNNHSVWRTYINSTFIKGPTGAVNQWPTYSIQPELQAQAKKMWEEIMPDWTHQAVLSDTVITWGGAMHCISRTLPKGTFARWIPSGTCTPEGCQNELSLAFDGSCETETDCTGPSWLCALNDCNKQGCGDISFEGCCENGAVRYCESEELKTFDCQGDPCGWDAAKSFYNCGQEGPGPPQFPIDCGGSTGCLPLCGERECGSDGCDGVCGVCPEGETCGGLDGGSCVPTEDPCEGLATEGCCDEGTLRWCESNAPRERACGSADNCGWNAIAGYYDCDTSGEGPPEYPRACPGKTTCERKCEGKTCGPDGCGGTCGSCRSGEVCDSGLCLPEGGGCGDIGPEGRCVGDTVFGCQGGSRVSRRCAECCGWLATGGYFDCLGKKACATPCQADCEGKACGSDGCGGLCGTCEAGYRCEAGTCSEAGRSPDAGEAPDAGPGDTGSGGDSGPGARGAGSSSGCAGGTAPATPLATWLLSLLLSGIVLSRGRRVRGDLEA